MAGNGGEVWKVWKVWKACEVINRGEQEQQGFIFLPQAFPTVPDVVELHHSLKLASEGKVGLAT